jgi:hypothetical protein
MHAWRSVGLREATLAALSNEWIGLCPHEIEAKADGVPLLIRLGLVGA